MIVKVKDPISALTHFIGAVLSLVAGTSLVMKAYYMDKPLYMLAFGIFGLSLVLLYSASTIYHIIDKPKGLNNILKRVDHMMIFVLIAGTYTPICLIPLGGFEGNPLGITILSVAWGIAAIGIILKIVWLNAPRWLYTMQYILMGWMVIVVIVPLVKSMQSEAVMWLVAGGIIYTIGGIIYALKWPGTHLKNFGFHEIFHIFVMGGSVCHYLMFLSLA